MLVSPGRLLAVNGAGSRVGWWFVMGCVWHSAPLMTRLQACVSGVYWLGAPAADVLIEGAIVCPNFSSGRKKFCRGMQSSTLDGSRSESPTICAFMAESQKLPAELDTPGVQVWGSSRTQEAA